MRFLLLLSLWLSAFFGFAQNTEQPDPLRPSPADSTQTLIDSTGTNSGLGEEDANELNIDDTLTYRVRLTADGTFTSGNVNRSLLQLVGSFDLALSKVAKLSTTGTGPG